MAHRMLSDDLIRLTIAAEGIATGRTTCSDRRAAALDRWITLLGGEVRLHRPDGWQALAPLLAAVEAGARDLVVVPEPRRRSVAAALAVALAGLRDHLIDALEAGAVRSGTRAWGRT